MTELFVKVQQGLLKGSVFTSVDGLQFLSFTGVPYAEPPIRKLRFKDPRPLKPWSGIRDATQESKQSAQIDSTSKTVVGDDDCLYLNIVTGALTGKRPVIVWIHGGAFAIGSNGFQLYSPDYLVKKDIVYVGINYRVGVLGFLNMDHEDCPGNQGLKDQIAALQWIQQNIEVFGGDPQNVTIMGSSAGAVSVHYLCISPIAKGLFHKAILHSGVVMNPWAFAYDVKKWGYELAEALGEDCCSSDEVIEYLRTIPAKKIVETWERLHPKHIQHLAPIFIPTLDSKSANPLFSQPRDELIQRGIDVPVLIGSNSEEGIQFFLVPRPDLIKDLNDKFEQKLIDLTKFANSTEVSKIAKDVRKFYFGDDPITYDKVDKIIQLLNDVYIVNGIQQAIEIQMQKSSPTYLYLLSRPPKYSMKNLLKIDIEGTSHGDELCYLFHSSLQCRGGKIEEGSSDYEMMERMTRMWTNFAKYGNPTPKKDELISTIWQPVTNNSKNYLRIGDNLVAGVYPTESWKLWRQVYL